MFLRTLGAVGLSAAGVVVLMPVVIAQLSRWGIVDVPNQRSSHDRPTVRGAGVVTGTVLAAALTLGGDRLTVALALTTLLATALGAIEDLRGVAVVPRLVSQAVIAAAFLGLTSPVDSPLSWLSSLGAVTFIVGYTNAFNFMDGINGISAATAAIAGFALVALGGLGSLPDFYLVGAALSVTALSFMPFNFPRARAFLGDSGSYSFGMVIGCAAVAAWRAGVRFDALLAPLALYLGDTATVVVRRAMQRQRVLEPHREHAYQRLVQLGASHAQTVGVVTVATVATSGLGLAVIDAGPAARALLDVAVVAVVAAYLALPRLVEARGLDG